MKTYPLFDPHSKLLGFFGCWPDDTNWPITRILFVSLTFTNHMVAMFFEFKYVYEKLNNPLEAFDAVNPTITKFITFYKLCTMIYFRKEFKMNHDKIRSYFTEDYKGSHFDIIFKATRSAYRYSMFIFLGGFITNFCFFLRPMANSLISHLTGGNYTRELPFKASVPFDLSKNPTYQIVYMLFAYSGLLTCVGFGGVDGLILSYGKYLSSQFDVISDKLRNDFGEIIDKTGIMSINSRQMKRIEIKLRPVVKHHIELVSRIIELSAAIWPIILCHFVSSAIEIGLSLIDFIKLQGFSTILYLIYALVVLSQLLVYCISGSNISNSTTDIHNAVYFSNWYRFSPKIRRDLLMLLVISTNGTSLRIPFFTPSLPAFRSILSAAMSYLTILQSFF